MKIVSLKANGEEFDPYKFSNSDNHEAIIVDGTDIATIRVTSLGEVTCTLHSQRVKASENFLLELGSIEGGDYDARQYIINGYNEYLYPFVKNDDLKDNKHILLDWVANNLKQEEELVIVTAGHHVVSQYIVIKHNDVGVSVDYYNGVNSEPYQADTFWFEDFEDTQYRHFPTACGVTATNQPNIVLLHPVTEQPQAFWYHSLFNSKDEALEFLKAVCREGVMEDDIGLDSDGALWLTMEEVRKGK